MGIKGTRADRYRDVHIMEDISAQCVVMASGVHGNKRETGRQISIYGHHKRDTDGWIHT